MAEEKFDLFPSSNSIRNPRCSGGWRLCACSSTGWGSARSVRRPKHSQRRGKTPVLQADEARALLDAIGTDHQPDQRLFVQAGQGVGVAGDCHRCER
jgi:hypothetical protein